MQPDSQLLWTPAHFWLPEQHSFPSPFPASTVQQCLYRFRRRIKNISFKSWLSKVTSAELNLSAPSQKGDWQPPFHTFSSQFNSSSEALKIARYLLTEIRFSYKVVIQKKGIILEMNKTGGTEDFHTKVVSILLQSSYSYFKVILGCFLFPPKHLETTLNRRRIHLACFTNPLATAQVHTKDREQESFFLQE